VTLPRPWLDWRLHDLPRGAQSGQGRLVIRLEVIPPPAIFKALYTGEDFINLLPAAPG
jgi:hypothetical protein